MKRHLLLTMDKELKTMIEMRSTIEARSQADLIRQAVMNYCKNDMVKYIK
jgi:hypothetical protein